MKTVGFIGLGNMAQALAAGFIRAGMPDAAKISAYAPNQEKLSKNADLMGFYPCSSLSELLDRSSEYADNSLMMILKILMISGIKEVNLAGFDGYSGTDANYLDEGKEYEFAKKKADYLNNYMSGFIRAHKDDIKVNFLTSTRYDIS